jgi:hypothetical protein
MTTKEKMVEALAQYAKTFGDAKYFDTGRAMLECKRRLERLIASAN